MTTSMQPYLRVNIFEGSRPVFGDAEMRLLDAIAREGTLTDGAAALGLSYRVAWGRLRAFEASLGTKLLETTVGGSGGGSSRLTPTAQRIVARYSAFRDAVDVYALQEFKRHFGEGASCSKLCLSEADSDSKLTEFPASLIREAVVSEATGELV